MWTHLSDECIAWKDMLEEIISLVTYDAGGAWLAAGVPSDGSSNVASTARSCSRNPNTRRWLHSPRNAWMCACLSKSLGLMSLVHLE